MLKVFHLFLSVILDCNFLFCMWYLCLILVWGQCWFLLFLFLILFEPSLFYSFPDGSDGKESACNVVVLGLIPGLGKSPGEGNGTSLQYSYLENPMITGAWQATVHGLTKSQTWLSHFYFWLLSRYQRNNLLFSHHWPQSKSSWKWAPASSLC